MQVLIGHKSKNTSVAGMVEARILSSGRGKVRLVKASELPADCYPTTYPRLTAWEIVDELIRSSKQAAKVLLLRWSANSARRQ